jgi:hypothetical protein
MTLFIYDRLIGPNDFCNCSEQINKMLILVEKGTCLRVYGPRNTGKTSLVKNIVAPKWEAIKPKKRIVLYADFYSVSEESDISLALTKAFNSGISSKQGLFDKTGEWMRALKQVKPTWTPDLERPGWGEFSVRTTNASESKIVDFETIIANVNALQIADKFEFLIILDEFQEISSIAKAEGKLRHALQQLSPSIPVIVLGSKYHLLRKIFEKPTAPFYHWGTPVEILPIPVNEYTAYINERFQRIGKSITPTASKMAQELLGRNPEATNRFCDFLADAFAEVIFDETTVKRGLSLFVDLSRSGYAATYAALSTSERSIVRAIARAGNVQEPNAKAFLAEVKLTPGGVSKIIERLLNNSILSRTETAADTKFSYHITDALFAEYVRRFQIL